MPRDDHYLKVDVSDAMAMINALRAVHTEHEMNQIIYRAFRRTGARVKTILRRDLPQKYEVKPSWVGSQVGRPHIQIGGNLGVNCTIPLDGKRGTIGGRFKAAGGEPEPGEKREQGKRYKINAQITKGKVSTLPPIMEHQGNKPPFRNTKSSLGEVAFTRMGKARLPIAKVAGIGVPQMPLNRSQDDVEKDILDTLMKRLEHEHSYIISKCR